jgi:hypothetical protein
MRAGDWKLVRPAIPGIRYATPADEALAARYVEADIAYKYQPETITGLLDIPEPNRIIPDPPPPELYNLHADPQEAHNLAEAEPERTRRMVSELDDWFAEVAGERRQVNFT